MTMTMSTNAKLSSTLVFKPSGRLGSRKSRTGCLTCKARKVKCDETKPHCKRCTNADKICQGYTDVFVSTSISDTQHARERINSLLAGLSVRTPSRSPSPVPPESRALQYYEVNVASILGGAVDSEFWTRSILQMGEAEPAVRQALVAISDLWEVQTNASAYDVRDFQQRSIENYNKALTTTARRVAEPEADAVALATCVLFLCLHCLQGDKQQVLKLLQSGSGVMIKVLYSLYESPTQRSTAKMFLPIFERMLILLRLFGEKVPSFRSPESLLYSDMEENFSHFKTLVDAGSALYWLVTETHELITKTRRHRHVPDGNDPNLPAYREEQELQLLAYATWLRGFENLCSTQRMSTKFERHVAVLRLTHAITYAWLSTCLASDEAAWNAYRSHFEVVVRNAEKVVAHKYSKDTESPPFTFEMGVIPPLYLTALKCREGELRQRALDVLSRAPAREGLWTRGEALRVAKRVVQLETSDYEVVGDGCIFRDATICDAQCKFTDETGTHVTFSAKLIGHEELWLVWDEVIPLDEDTSSSPQSPYALFTSTGVH